MLPAAVVVDALGLRLIPDRVFVPEGRNLAFFVAMAFHFPPHADSNVHQDFAKPRSVETGLEQLESVADAGNGGQKDGAIGLRL